MSNFLTNLTTHLLGAALCVYRLRSNTQYLFKRFKCGCQKCGGKHDQNLILLCDMCDAEYVFETKPKPKPKPKPRLTPKPRLKPNPKPKLKMIRMMMLCYQNEKVNLDPFSLTPALDPALDPFH